MATPLGQQPAWLGGAPLGGVPTPVGAMTVRPAGDPVVRRRRLGGAVAVLGGALIIAGTFADWVRADIRGLGIRDGSGWDNVHGHVADGPVIAALGLVLVIVGMTFVVGMSSPLARAVGVLASLAAAGATAYEIVDIASAPNGVSTSLQVGVWLMVAGAVVGCIGLLVTLAAKSVPAAQPPAWRPPAAMPAAPPSGPPLLG